MIVAALVFGPWAKQGRHRLRSSHHLATTTPRFRGAPSPTRISRATSSRSFRSLAAGAVAALAALPKSASAASQYFPQLTTGITVIQQVVQITCFVALIVLLAAIAWEFMQTRRIGAIIGEILGAIVVVVIAANGQTIATALGLSAASIGAQHAAAAAATILK